MLMMRLDRTDKSGWSSLHDDLVGFGHESELFSDIKVRSHGKQMSDPLSIAGEGQIRIICKHSGCRLWRESELANSGGCS